MSTPLCHCEPPRTLMGLGAWNLTLIGRSRRGTKETLERWQSASAPLLKYLQCPARFETTLLQSQRSLSIQPYSPWIGRAVGSVPSIVLSPILSVIPLAAEATMPPLTEVTPLMLESRASWRA